MFLPSFRSPSFRVLLIVTVAAATIPFTAFGAALIFVAIALAVRAEARTQ